MPIKGDSDIYLSGVGRYINETLRFLYAGRFVFLGFGVKEAVCKTQKYEYFTTYEYFSIIFQCHWVSFRYKYNYI